MTDPIADMLARIRNAVAAKHSRVDIPASKLKLEIARILKEEGYINNFVIKGEGAKKLVRIFLVTTRAVLLRLRTWRACRARDGECMSGRIKFRACWAAMASISFRRRAA